MPDEKRRWLIKCAGAAALGAAARPGWSAASLRVPEIDRLTLHVLVDAATFGFAVPERRADLVVERAPPRPAGEQQPRHTLGAEFGLSLLAESIVGQQTRRVMIDFGYTPEVLLNNLALQRIDLSNVDAMVLSHGHFDHFGGITALLGEGVRLKTGVPLWVGGEEIFCARETLLAGSAQSFGRVPREQLTAAGIRIMIATEPAIVAEHAFTTGEIPLRSFERTINPTIMKPGEGCRRELLSEDKRALTKVPDDLRHELATCYVVKDRGLVVQSSCSHRGILNAVQRAREVTGVDHVHAVIGGFHLVWPRTDEDAVRTVDALQGIDPDYIIPMHCSGEAFIAEALRRMPRKVIRPYVGSRFVFGQVS
jgi:7,8-dihydropterin-6-yl-methyl-4-(beta-D-ribofuranosyl)aminobenzene 5'-phosphate synthase